MSTTPFYRHGIPPPRPRARRKTRTKTRIVPSSQIAWNCPLARIVPSSQIAWTCPLAHSGSSQHSDYIVARNAREEARNDRDGARHDRENQRTILAIHRRIARGSGHAWVAGSGYSTYDDDRTCGE